jgi:hypothetical protein
VRERSQANEHSNPDVEGADPAKCGRRAQALRLSATALVNPDFVAFARAFGARAERVERVERSARFPAAFVRARPVYRRRSSCGSIPDRSRRRVGRAEPPLGSGAEPGSFLERNAETRCNRFFQPHHGQRIRRPWPASSTTEEIA